MIGDTRNRSERCRAKGERTYAAGPHDVVRHGVLKPQTLWPTLIGRELGRARANEIIAKDRTWTAGQSANETQNLPPGTLLW
jgi:hypothetical protein